jgi:hypothetical protein
MFTVIFTYLSSGIGNTTEVHNTVKAFDTVEDLNYWLGHAQENAAEGIGTYDHQAYTITVYNGQSLERFGHFHWNDEPVFYDAVTGFFLNA